jgi:hypothetical protein
LARRAEPAGLVSQPVGGSRPSHLNRDPNRLRPGSGQQDQDRPSSRGSASEKVTVNLTSRAAKALNDTVTATGTSKTEAINKAIQLYGFILEHLDAGGAIYVRDPGSKETERLRIF